MSNNQRAGPKGTGTDVKQALLEAGCSLYEEHGLRGVSLREIADQAGVNQAMVRYYFKDKDGFEMAMLDWGAQRLRAALSDKADFKATFRAAVQALNAMPWFPVLIMRTVHIGDTQREHFITTYAPMFMELLGRHSRGDSKFESMSILSLLVLPQLTRNMSSELLGINFDDEFAEQYSDYVSQFVRDDG